MLRNITYLIPTYNERENILPMLAKVESVFKKLKINNFKILVIDDSSPDGTGELVKRYSLKNKNVILLSGKKEGLGKAMTRGYKYALKYLNPDVIISNEADFSYNPSAIKIMIQKLEFGYDAVFGSRKIENTKKWPIVRRLIHFIANTVCATYIAGVTEVDDHNSAFKAVKVKGVLEKINFEGFPAGFSFFNYFTYKVSQNTSKIYEFKTTFTPRTRGVSKMMLSDSKEYILNCFQIRMEEIFG